MTSSKTRIEICRSCARRQGFFEKIDVQTFSTQLYDSLNSNSAQVILEQCQRYCPEGQIVVAVQALGDERPNTTYVTAESPETLIEEIKKLLSSES